MTSLRGVLLPFLFLFLMLNVVNAGLDTISVTGLLEPESGQWHLSIDVYQVDCITAYGVNDARCAGVSRPFYIDMPYMFNGSFSQTTLRTGSFTWSACVNNSMRCYADIEINSFPLKFNPVYYGSMAYGNSTEWLTCKNLLLYTRMYDDGSGQGMTMGTGAPYRSCYQYSPTGNWWSFGDFYLGDVATETGILSAAFHVCVQPYNFQLGAKKEGLPSGNTTGLQMNYVPSCVPCIAGEISCEKFGNIPANGQSYICDSSGSWVALHKCELLGWVDCGLGSALECPGASVNITIANMNNEKERISLTDNVGRLLSWKGTNYEVFSGQTIIRTRFKFVDRYTSNPWLLTGSELVSIVHSWNATEMSCTKDAGVSSFSPGASVYVDNSNYNCVLEAGYTVSNLTITIQANLSSHGSIVPISTTLTKTFIAQVISDMALLDNVQVLYIDSSHIAFSGHIIKYSDLTEIPESKNPYVFFNYTFFDNTSTTTINGGGNTGKLNATDANFLYYLKASTGQEIGSLVIFNATVGADGFNEEIYNSDSVYMSPVRLLFFKCKNVPKNTTLRTELSEPFYYSKAVKYECAYVLANPSDILTIDLANKSHVYKSNDVGGEPDNPSQTFIEAWTLEFLGLSTYGSAVEVPFNQTIGNTLYYKLSEAVYTLLGENDAPSLLDSGRYVGRWSLVDNPIFYQVKTYVDLIIEEEPFGGFVFNDEFIYFNQTLYNQGDGVICTVTYFDTDGIVNAWSATLSGDAGYSSTVYSGIAQTCNSTSPTQDTCIVQQSDCVGNIGDEFRQCSIYIGLAGIQYCVLSAPGTNVSLATTDCLGYKNQFFTGRGTNTLTCSVTLFKADGAGGEVTHSTTAKVVVTGKDFFGDTYSAWWFWPLLILLIIVALLMLKWKLQGGRRG